MRGKGKGDHGDLTAAPRRLCRIKHGAGSDPPPDTADTVVGNISVAEALNSLNEAERMVVSMKVLSDMTFKEIAEQTGIPMGTVTWRYREAMKRLRRYGFDEGSE